jgi:hypothetical protein
MDVLLGATVVLSISFLLGLCYGKVFHLFTKNRRRNIAKSILLGFPVLAILVGLFHLDIMPLVVGIVVLPLQHCACGSEDLRA